MQRPTLKVQAISKQTISKLTNPVARVVVATVPVVIGGAIICAAAGIIPIKGHAPVLVLYAVGGTFALAGLAAVLQEIKIAAAQFLSIIFGFLVLCGMLVIFGWLFFYSPVASTGGFTFNVMKWFWIGFVGLIVLLLAVAKLWPDGPIKLTSISQAEQQPQGDLEITSRKHKRR
jgi:hypothetical protein